MMMAAGLFVLLLAMMMAPSAAQELPMPADPAPTTPLEDSDGLPPEPEEEEGGDATTTTASAPVVASSSASPPPVAPTPPPYATTAAPPDAPITAVAVEREDMVSPYGSAKSTNSSSSSSIMIDVVANGTVSRPHPSSNGDRQRVYLFGLSAPASVTFAAICAVALMVACMS